MGISILQIKKWRLRKVEPLIPHHTASWDKTGILVWVWLTPRSGLLASAMLNQHCNY